MTRYYVTRIYFVYKGNFSNIERSSNEMKTQILPVQVIEIPVPPDIRNPALQVQAVPLHPAFKSAHIIIGFEQSS